MENEIPQEPIPQPVKKSHHAKPKYDLMSEEKKLQQAARQKRKYAEKVRMAEREWSHDQVAREVSEWQGGPESDKFIEYCTLWKWLDIRAKKEDKDISKFLITKGGIRLGLEYLRRVHDDEMEDYSAKGLREVCQVKMDDYLLWSESELAEFVFRCEQLVETDRMVRQTHVVRKEMIKGIKSGDKKSIQMWLEMTGRDDAGEPDSEGFTLKVVDQYNVESDEAIPGEVKVIPFKAM